MPGGAARAGFPMKAAPFDYARADSIEEACALLAANPDARLIAGGQTLIPMLAMRLARPALLVDIARIAELRAIEEVDGAVVIGAAVRQAECERSPLIRDRLPLLAAVLPWVGHPPTRRRGTVGGSIANADPSAEIALVLLTLGGGIVVQDGDGQSEIRADELFLGPMLTTVPEGACLVNARFPIWSESRVGVGFHEVSARRSDFAFASVATQVAVADDGSCLRAVAGVGGVGDMPLALDVEGLVGQVHDTALVKEVVAAAFEDIESFDDLHASAAYRKRVGVALACRAIADAFAASRKEVQ